MEIHGSTIAISERETQNLDKYTNLLHTLL